jgi:ribosomal protein L27
MTTHAEDELENDGLSIFDVENAILSGEIIERQRDNETMSGNISLGVNHLTMMR